MFGRDHKKKYLRYTDSVDDDNNSEESENGKGNIDLIINKLEKKVNTGNINSGNQDVILKMISKNQDITRTTKNNDSLLNNISNLLPKNIKEKDNEVSQDIGSSIISVNSIAKGIKKPSKTMIDVDISLNNDLKDELEMQENNEGNKQNLILSTNNSNANSNNNILSRNKIINIGETNNLSTLSTHLDNSRFFLNKKNNGLITATKMEKENKDKNDKDINVKLAINEDKKIEKDKEIKNKKDKNKKINKKNNIVTKNRNNSIFDYCCDKRAWRIRRRNCNFITILRDIFITIIIVSALAFYATIFIVG